MNYQMKMMKRNKLLLLPQAIAAAVAAAGYCCRSCCRRLEVKIEFNNCN